MGYNRFTNKVIIRTFDLNNTPVDIDDLFFYFSDGSNFSSSQIKRLSVGVYEKIFSPSESNTQALNLTIKTLKGSKELSISQEVKIAPADFKSQLSDASSRISDNFQGLFTVLKDNVLYIFFGVVILAILTIILSLLGKKK